MRLSAEQRAENERLIYQAMNRLLAGNIPPGGGCDVKTLAAEAGLDRRAFYGGRAYAHLREEFEARVARSVETGGIPDERERQIARLKEQLAELTRRVAERDQLILELSELNAIALSRLAAQHDEIIRLRASATPKNVLRLPTRSIAPAPVTPPTS